MSAQLKLTAWRAHSCAAAALRPAYGMDIQDNRDFTFQVGSSLT